MDKSAWAGVKAGTDLRWTYDKVTTNFGKTHEHLGTMLRGFEKVDKCQWRNDGVAAASSDGGAPLVVGSPDSSRDKYI